MKTLNLNLTVKLANAMLQTLPHQWKRPAAQRFVNIDSVTGVSGE